MSELARREGVPASAILAAGDHWNDLTMLRRERARCLVAPANAIGPVKDAVRSQGGFVSDEICGSGVLAGIEHYLRAAGEERATDV
jgi:hydroxymethylpyrimidine pyrophosphatase-like HAD family hydrolase